VRLRFIGRYVCWFCDQPCAIPTGAGSRVASNLPLATELRQLPTSDELSVHVL